MLAEHSSFPRTQPPEPGPLASFLHDLAVMLVASGDIDARERLREKLPTSGLVIIDFAFDDWGKLHPQSGRLERFVSPKSLEAAAN